MDFNFTHPQYLPLLFLIPLLIILHFVSIKMRGRKALKFANFDAIARIKGVDLYSKNLLGLILGCIVIFSLTMAMAGLNLHGETESSSFSFVIAIDSSTSMEANDLTPSRFEAAKSLATSFVDSSKPGTRFGVISFSGDSIIEQEMTEDISRVNAAIENMEIGTVGGTDFAEAVIISVSLMKNEENKAIFFLSDGQNNVGQLDEIINYAEENKIIIHTIAMGKLTGGETGFGMSKLNEDSLKALAYNTDGKYFLIENKQELENSFEDIMKLRIREINLDLTQEMILLSIILIIIEYILINTRYKALP